MVARPRPPPSQTRTKSSAPAAAPTARSAIAARFTSFSITTGRCQASLSASRAPSCHVGQVDRQARVAGPRVDHAGAADHQRAQPGHVDARARAGPFDGAADQPDRIVGAARINAYLGHPAAGDVGHRGADQVGFNVEPGDVGAGRDDGVQRGVRAAAPGLLARDRDQAALLQPGQHLRHRNLGHSGVLADLGPREQLAAEQQGQGGPVVQLAQQARRARPDPAGPALPAEPVFPGKAASRSLRHSHGPVRSRSGNGGYLIGKFPVSFSVRLVPSSLTPSSSSGKECQQWDSGKHQRRSPHSARRRHSRSRAAAQAARQQPGQAPLPRRRPSSRCGGWERQCPPRSPG